MAEKSIAWDSGGGYITLTYSGSGNGTITVESDANTLGTSRSKTITIQTVGGAVTKNLTVSQAVCPFPVGTTKNYSYTGSYQEVELPAGKYKLQCWGAQGGSNGTKSTYGITAKAGGKGGYSEGVITLNQKTTVRVYVGGQGSSSSGGYNGGGSTSGTAQYNSGDTFGYSKMGGGGGATDIRLSDGALLSRMIVAGGGSGGAMCYKKVTTSTTTRVNDSSYNSYEKYPFRGGTTALIASDIPVTGGFHYYLTGTGRMANSNNIDLVWVYYNAGASVDDVMNGTVPEVVHDISGHDYDDTAPAGYDRLLIYSYVDNAKAQSLGLANYEVFYLTGSFTLALSHDETTTTVDEYNDSQVGFAGGGTNGVGYSSSYYGKQNSAGTNGSFGQGANQTATNYRYASGAGGGGWYGGGGGQKSDSSMTYCKYSGGGSGFVNTAASAGNRPSGYTGLQLDSGETKAGNTSFPSTSGGTETGHSGNGYARITRLS